MGTLKVESNIPVYNLYSALGEQIEQDAAICIQRAWRRSRSRVALLKSDKDIFAALSHIDYKKFCKQLLQPTLSKMLEYPSRHETVKNAITSFQQYRKKFHEKNFVVLCTSIVPDEMPDCEIIHRTKLPAKIIRIGEIYLTEKAQEQFNKIHFSAPSSKKDLDKIARTLAKKTSIVPWKYGRDGCYARARFMIDYMTLCGISIDCVSRQYIFLPPDIRKQNWTYHVAPIIRIKDGSFWVMDPAFNRNEVMTLKKWIQKQKKDPADQTRIVNRRLVRSSERSKSSNYFADKGLIFRADPYTSLGNFDFDKRTFDIRFLKREEQEAVRVLSKYRVELENPWLTNILPKKA